MIDFIKSLLFLIKFINTSKEDKKYVFFSESKFYKNHFVNLIEDLINLGEKNIYYICNNKEEFDFFKNKVNAIFINNRFFIETIFISLSCKNLITTMTDLDENFAKSKNCDYYIYFFHALASTHKIYKKNAFKNYDVIFSNGPYQTNELKKAEEVFSFPQKKIFDIGYFYLDYLKNNAKTNLSKKNCVLFAPSWNYNDKNLFDDYGYKIIEKLISKNFHVILRPHSEHFKRSKKKINQIKNSLDKNLFTLDINLSNIPSMEKSEILLTDNSSIISEYLFTFKRPILKINYFDKIHNDDYHKVDLKTFDDIIIDKFGHRMEIKNLNNLTDNINNILKSKLHDQEISEFIKLNLSNFGFSCSTAAKTLKDEF